MEIKENNQEQQETKAQKEGKGKTSPGPSKDASKNTATKSGKRKTTGKKESPSNREADRNTREKPDKTSKTSQTSTQVKISIDSKPEEVVELNNQGVELYFDDTKDGFLELPSNVAEDLGFYNKQRYFTARNIVQGALDLSSNKEGYNPQPGQATASEQMAVYGKDARFHYCWKRPDELRQAQRQGYRVANDPNLDTFYGGTGTSHLVGEKGQEELVLMKTPRDNYEQSQKEIVKKSKARRAAVEDNAWTDLQKGGGQPYRDQEGE